MFGNLTSVKRFLNKKAEKFSLSAFDYTNLTSAIDATTTDLVIKLDRKLNEEIVTLLVTDVDSALATSTLSADVLGGDDTISVWTVSTAAIAAGTYTVVLSATDAKGRVASLDVSVTIV